MTRAESVLEAAFAALCEENPHWGPYRREVKLIPGRRFSMDFVFDDMRLVVEIDGIGGRSAGGHCTPAGVSMDREKDALLQLLGWHVLRFTTYHFAPKPKRKTRKKNWAGYVVRTMNKAAKAWG